MGNHNPDRESKPVLVIDDDMELCELLTEFLEPEGFKIDPAHTGPEGFEKAVNGNYLLIVLDVMLPGMNGFDLLRELRRRKDTPVLMLTAKGEEVDRIVGLEMGADDYLPKPFNPRELLARIRAIMRRISDHQTEMAAESAPVSVGDLVLDPGSRCVWRGNAEIELTAAEFDLLGILLKNAGKVVTREELSRRVLGRRLTPDDRSVDVHISSLRRKLGKKTGEPEYIRTIRGIGYQYAASGTEKRKSEREDP